jgi:outer membrane protein assembly factor BamA
LRHVRRLKRASLLCAGAAVVAAATAAGTQAQAGTPADSAPVDGKPTSWVVLPALFYTPETRVGGGGAVFFTRRRPPDGRPNTAYASALYTQEKQSVLEVAGNLYTTADRYLVSGFAGYREFPTTFYGVGNATLEDGKERYTPRTIEARLGLERRVRRHIRVGGSYDFARRTMVEVEAGGLLDGRLVPGAEGGVVSGLGASVAWDDRESIFAPASGSFHTFSSRVFGGVIGGDHSFTTHRLDLRTYRQIHRGHIMALQGLVRATTGDPPFQMMPTLGGQNLLRGYYDGRYRDRHALVAQAEYRAHVAWRIGAVAFAGAGQVAPRAADFHLDGFHLSGGGGLRLRLDQRNRRNLRLDFGIGESGASGMYITVGEAF